MTTTVPGATPPKGAGSGKLTLAQAKRLLAYKRATQRAPRAYDDTTTRQGLERVLKAIQKRSRVAAWIKKLIGR